MLVVDCMMLFRVHWPHPPLIKKESESFFAIVSHNQNIQSTDVVLSKQQVANSILLARHKTLSKHKKRDKKGWRVY